MGSFIGSKGPKNQQKSPKHSIMHATVINVILYMGDMALMSKICEKNTFFVIFDYFWDLWSPDMTPYPTPDAL